MLRPALSDSFDFPYHLKFVGRRAQNVARGRHKIGLLNGREGFRSLVVKVEIEMLNRLYIVLRSRVGFGFERVHSDVDIGAVSVILVSQPVLKLGGRDPYRRADALERFSALAISHQNRQAVGGIKIRANIFWRGDVLLIRVFGSHGVSP